MRVVRLLVATAVAFALPGVITAGATPRTPAAGGDTTTHNILTAHYYYAPGDSSVASTPPLRIFQGDSLIHTNLDADLHNLESLQTRPDGTPWFKSALIGAGQSAPVAVEDVPPGTYDFICTIHPFMSGKLEIVPRVLPVPESGGDVQVEASDSSSSSGFFAPKQLTVPAGTTVQWKNTGKVAHSVTAADGSWDSSPACPSANQACLQPGSTFSHTFLQPGTYLYYCKLHGTPRGTGHAGVIHVVAPGATRTSVDSEGTSVAGGGLAVTGNATFGGESPVAVARDPAGDAPGTAQTSADTGVDLTGASVYRPDPAIPSVFFEWHLTGLPATGSLPEAVRYTIPFRVGDQVFQVMAKLTDLVDPDRVGVYGPPFTDNADIFALRGPCVVGNNVAPSGLCPFIARLTGSFDVGDGTVLVKVPLGATPQLVAGAVLSGNTSAASDLSAIQAGYQLAPGAEAVTADQAAWIKDLTYRISDRVVLVGLAPHGTPLDQVSFSTPATVSADGSFSATAPSPGPGTWDVWTRACFGDNCAVRSTTITL